MNLEKCSNGHFYDASKYASCPHCANGADDAVPNITMPATEAAVTVGVTSSAAVPSRSLNDDAKTISAIQLKDTEVAPVVGWLVCIEGENKGCDFRLKAGKNFVGRANENDIAISKDMSISRAKHVVIIFEPNRCEYLIQPGSESHELSYVNGEILLDTKKLNAYDKISLGNTTLSFVPFCGEEFKW